MNWKSHYQQADMANWTGRIDAENSEYIYQVIEPLNFITSDTTNGIAFLGFCSDAGVRRNLGRVGAAEGPKAIRNQLAKCAIHSDFTLFDAGDIVCIQDNLETSQAALAEAISLLQQKKIFPIVLGGGHETSWGHFQGLEKHHNEIAIINFDAHFDMRRHSQNTSGTPFLQIADHSKHFDYSVFGIQPYSNTRSLFATANQFGVTYVTAFDIFQKNNLLEDIHSIIERTKAIYLSICLDVFAAAYAPGVSAVQPNGLIPNDVIPAIRALAKSGKVISMDIVELAPKYDPDERTAKLAALLISEFLHHL